MGQSPSVSLQRCCVADEHDGPVENAVRIEDTSDQHGIQSLEQEDDNDSTEETWRVALMRLKVHATSHSHLQETGGLVTLKSQLRDAISLLVPELDSKRNVRIDVTDNLSVYVFLQPPAGSSTTLPQVMQALRVSPAMQELLRRKLATVAGLRQGEPLATLSPHDIRVDTWCRAGTSKADAGEQEEYYYSMGTGMVSWHLPAYQDDEDADEEVPSPQAVHPAPVIAAEEEVEDNATNTMVLGFAYGKREIDITFFERPIGMVWFEGDVPIKVCEVRQESLAREAGVKKGYKLTHVNYEQVDGGKKYDEVYKLLMETCNALPMKGDLKKQSEA
mmetsp:Transcript_10032/g.22521  ORF Transcript_10032/g.22521 Transcript_10032/m.22521 type:complete len:332 (+) Transcript_10032:49-1044(+)